MIFNAFRTISENLHPSILKLGIFVIMCEISIVLSDAKKIGELMALVSTVTIKLH